VDKKPKSTGWWQTLPGILTATAGILTAIGGLIVAFQQAGFFDRASQKARQVQNETVTPPKITETPGTIPSSTNPPPTGQTAPYPLGLPAGTEVRVRKYVYKILTARLDRYGPGKLSLTFDVRMTNKDGIPANFWGNSFRLLVDGVPTAPDNFLNDVVDGHSAKEGVVEFEIPDTTTKVGLQVGDVGEGAPAITITLKPAKP
jgi:hypothetical protein